MFKILQSAGSNFIVLCFGVVLGAFLLFLFQNWETLTSTSITLQWIVVAEKPLWFWLAFFFIIGVVLTYTWTLKGRYKMAKMQKKTKKQLQELQSYAHSSEKEDKEYNPTDEESHG